MLKSLREFESPLLENRLARALLRSRAMGEDQSSSPVSSSRRTPPLEPAARPIDLVWRPHYAVWELTLGCNLACNHCSSRAGRGRPDELTTDESLRLVEQLADLGVEEVTLIGGEAYLRKDWLQIVRAIRRREMRCTLVSGGRGLGLDLARAARDAGLQSVSVSVDGLEVSHDALRGFRGSFRAAIEALRCVRCAEMQVTANTQISLLNLRDIPGLFGRLVEEGIAAWQVQITVPMGRAADHPELILEPYRMIELMPMLARLKASGDQAGVLFWLGNNVGYFGPHEADLRDALPGAYRGSCGAGRAAIGIESNGNIKGCPSLPSAEYVGGNVREFPLRDIWERAPRLGFMRERSTADLWGHCKTCYYAAECLGGCSWMAHSVMGRPGNNPYCHHRALTLLHRGRRERIVLRNRAKGAPFDLATWDLVEEAWPEAELERARAVARGEAEWLMGGPLSVANGTREDTP